MRDQLEQDLSTSLARRAEVGAPTVAPHLDVVRGRARQIRRRRNGVKAGLAAAVAAVLIPGAFLVAPAFERGAEVPVAPTPTPEQVVVPDHARAGNETMNFRDLPLGPTPTIGYLDLSGERPVVVAGGNETVLDLVNIPIRYTHLEDGRFVVLTRDEGGTWFIEVADPGGTTQEVYPNTSGFAVDATHTQVAWGDGDAVQVLSAGTERPRILGELPGFATLAVTDLDGSDCFTTVDMSFGCVVRVTATTAQFTRTDFTMTMDAATSVTDTNEDFFRHADSIQLGDPQETGSISYSAGIRASGDGSAACSEVQGTDPSSPETSTLIETCDHRFDSFASDGRTLLAWESWEFQGDGLHTVIGMYDMASRELLWSRSSTTRDMGKVMIAEWEDADQLLAPVFQGGKWQLVRFGHDGAIERVTDSVKAEEADSPFLPEAQHSVP